MTVAKMEGAKLRRVPGAGAAIVLAVLLCARVAMAQLPAAEEKARDAEENEDHSQDHVMNHEGMDHRAMKQGGTEHAAMMMGPLGTPRSRLGSGTSWLPDSSPMYGFMAPLGRGGFMFHENVFVGYDWFASDRAGRKFISVNSAMAMAWHPIGPGELTGRLMLSAEPLTVGKNGYPLVLQSGETANGQALHDRQHPHDFFMELAVQYVVPVSESMGIELYVAPSGEPALGPTAYPHRISAISDPLAPIGHHWQDSTHISFGVLTAGVFTRTIKLEGSWFNGREPDENRWNMDVRVPDSYSGRLSLNPDERWNAQVSYGYLRTPEPLEPDVSLHRLTASGTYNSRMGDEANWAITLVVGENIADDGVATGSALLESNWNLDGHHVLFGRAEYVRKAGHELALAGNQLDSRFDVGLLGLGYAYYLGPFSALMPALGARGSVGLVPRALEPFYGSRTPIGAIVFVQVRPRAMRM